MKQFGEDVMAPWLKSWALRLTCEGLLVGEVGADWRCDGLLIGNMGAD